jgi:hypothetical protein
MVRFFFILQLQYFFFGYLLEKLNSSNLWEISLVSIESSTNMISFVLMSVLEEVNNHRIQGILPCKL